jgi:hypothetical protein
MPMAMVPVTIAARASGTAAATDASAAGALSRARR